MEWRRFVTFFMERPSYFECTLLPTVKAKGVYSSSCKPISESLRVTCHPASHSVSCHPTQVTVPRLNPSHLHRFTYPKGI